MYEDDSRYATDSGCYTEAFVTELRAEIKRLQEENENFKHMVNDAMQTYYEGENSKVYKEAHAEGMEAAIQIIKGLIANQDTHNDYENGKHRGFEIAEDHIYMAIRKAATSAKESTE